MALEKQVMGLFTNEDQAVSAIKELTDSPWILKRVHSPIPSHRIAEALKLKKSPVGFFTLCGGIFGFVSGFALAAFTAARWDLIISGKPILAWIPFVIVGFEFTILFSVLGNVAGLLILARLPSLAGLKTYDPRCSGDHFGVLAACDVGQQQELQAFFQHKGAEIRVFE
jgi:molybdopterin-containing oxidoreductase family membrane subunit